MRAIILAGGKGMRLRPYTAVLPKPLMPIGEKPILLIIIEQLANQGFTHITIAVGHGADLIMAYFGDGTKWGITIDYTREEKPLHTIGPLTLIPDLPENFLVMNGDTFTDLAYGAFLQKHIKNKHPVSVAVKKRELKIDFGVLSFGEEDCRLTDFTEKPTHEAYVAMGVNCIHRSVIESLSKGEWYGFDALMKDSLAHERPVFVYPHDGIWIDIGRPEDYQYVVDHYDEFKMKLGVTF